MRRFLTRFEIASEHPKMKPGRGTVYGLTQVSHGLMRDDCAQLYRENWDGCRQVFKRHYRYLHHGWRLENQ